MKLVYKKINKYDYEQIYIEDNDSIPAGWTDDRDSLKIETPISEVEQLNEKIEKGQDDIATVGAAVAEIFEMLSNGGEEQDG